MGVVYMGNARDWIASGKMGYSTGSTPTVGSVASGLKMVEVTDTLFTVTSVTTINSIRLWEFNYGMSYRYKRLVN